jgi:amino acid adenylation domain-containing protein/thioester reductase-like protein
MRLSLSHQVIAQQCRRTPESLAVWSERGAITYRELDARANRLAHRLRRRGVGPEVLVAVYLPRSIEAIVAALGIWKAGGAYLPLDPHYPIERLRTGLADASARIVVTGVAAELPFAPGDAHVIELASLADDRSGDRSGDGESAPDDVARPDHLAYMLYTSGSTGAPKGVMVSHGALANHLRWRHDRFPLAPDDRFLHKASLAFDISIWEFAAPLWSGARCVLARPDGQRDSGYLAALVRDQAVTVAHLGPALLRALLAEPAFAQCRALRRIFSGGEVLSVELCRQLFERLPVQLHHQYGPTETTIDVCCWDCDPDERRPRVPLGGAVHDTALYVLDASGAPVARGEIGELFVAGASLARGYRGRAAATADRFVPDPFGGPGARMYRTGDRVRRGDDDALAFVGRADRQVKLRGYRIELEEIEAALADVDGIAEAAVVVHAGSGDDRLVAYIAPAATRPDLGELHAQLARRLPDFMIPALVVPLAALPRTTTGKLDLRALPPPTADNRLLPRPGTAPLAQEQQLARIWAETLGVAAPGRDDHFVALGGDSILAVTLAARVRAVGLQCAPYDVFAHPTIARLAAALQPIVPPASGGGRAAAGDGDPYPLSPMQLSLLYRELHAPRAAFYVEQLRLELEGPLDAALLAEAWRQIVALHPALRTVFRWQELAAPRQVVLPDPPCALAIIDAPGGDRELREQLARDRARGFDLADAAPHRAALYRLTSERHALVWTVHHIVIDGWSAARVLQQLFEAYAALLAGRPAPFRASAAFRAFIDWLGARDASAEAAFWRARAGAASFPLPDPDDDDHEAASSLSSAELAGLRALAARCCVTLGGVLAATWAMVWTHRRGEARARTGVAVSGRGIDLAGADEIVGPLLNTLPIDLDAAPTASVASVLERTQAALAEGLAHEQTPISEIQRWLGVPQGHAPFEALLIIENYPNQVADWRPAGTPLIVRRRWGAAHSPYAITLTARIDAGLELWALVRASRHGRARAERWIADYRDVLRALASRDLDAACSVRELCARAGLVARARSAMTGPAAALPADASCARQFEDQAARTPDAIAARFGDARVTYRELDRRANRLAHLLVRRGAGPERCVGLFVERSLDLIVTVLAVMKAGAAYVPLDPSYPADRIAHVARDAGAGWILTQRHLCARQSFEPARVLVAEDLAAELAACPDTAPARAEHALGIAYVLYTSGSTGKPKGVMVPHRALSNFLRAMQRAPGLRTGDVVLALTSLAFDIAALELLLPLCVGATIVVAPQAWQLDGAALSRGLAASAVDVVQATPTMWQMLLATSAPRLAGLRALCGGEAMPPTLARELLSRAAEVWNLYGPTETTIWSTVHRLAEPDACVSLGRPIDNTAIYLLDADGAQVAVGAPGELYIGGAGVARGYLGQPALTAERFVPDPFAGSGARMYRTGDLARVADTGELELIGRGDQQVKIRGHRVELGEIEATICQEASVARCAVAFDASAPGTGRLIAYVVRAPGHARVDVGALRRRCAAGLPAVMMPECVVELEQFPLTPNGKLDRRALPLPPPPSADPATVAAGAAANPSAAPATPTERTIAALWRELLGVEIQHTDQSFFASGGHSLLFIQLLVRARKAFGCELPLQALQADPTIAGMAAAIDRFGGAEPTTMAPGRPEIPDDDLRLPADIQISPAPPARTPRNILLTGATGLVGAYLLRELRRQLPDARVHCLVRAAGARAAHDRIARVLDGFADPSIAGGVAAIAGDLEQPRLGLDAAGFAALSDDIDAVYHCGAHVNFLYPYAALRAANVVGTASLLALASRGQPKTFHHVSTLSVLPLEAADAPGTLLESFALQDGERLTTGYARTKWAAERLVAEARDRGMAVTIHRLGIVSGDSETGRWNTNDFACRALKAYIQLGSMPLLDGVIEMIPVDYATRAVVHISRGAAALGKTFHLVHPRPAPATAVHRWLAALGYPLRLVSYGQWYAELCAAARRSNTSALLPLIPLLAPQAGGAAPFHPFSERRLVSVRNADAALAGSAIRCPDADEALVRVYLERFVADGFLEAAARQDVIA